MHYVVVSLHILQIAEIPTANTLTKYVQKMKKNNGQKLPFLAIIGIFFTILVIVFAVGISAIHNICRLTTM